MPKSPFLEHGFTQPVDWHEWGEEPFERARVENRPVLLDIGAVWCHWCHVMDRESYEDQETASLVNELFIPVKVDRDERPDVDARYQRAVQILTGQGGWPLTAFLTPDGEVFYGGTYFPPQDGYGRPSFRRVLREVARVWNEDRERAVESARGIADRLEEYAQVEVESGEPDRALVSKTLEELAKAFDFRYGGFGRAPKFPNAGALDLVMDAFVDHELDWMRRVVAETLVAMAKGGIYDQIGGGFHRYSTDARWIVPHFEKMAYDNGTLLATFARASALFQDPVLERAARGIMSHYQDIAPTLIAEGGFPASQDADRGDNDGDYWTWTSGEIEEALDDETLVRAARLRYGLDDPAGAMHLDPSRHVLFEALDIDGVAARLEVDTDKARDLLERVSSRLKEARDRRARPYIDTTLYSGWVALVAAGHLAAARHLGAPDAAETAVRALDRVWNDAFEPGRGVHHRLGDPDSGELLEDQAQVAAALLDAFEVTQEERYAERAAELLRVTLERFRNGHGGLNDRPSDAIVVGALARAYQPIADAPAPSGNGTAALALLRLAEIDGTPTWREAALAIIRAFSGSAPRLGSGAATFMKALDRATGPTTAVVIVDAAPASESALLARALRRHRPRTTIRLLAPDRAPPAALPAALRAMLSGDAPRAYVCSGTVCEAPVDSPDALDDLLSDFRPEIG